MTKYKFKFILTTKLNKEDFVIGFSLQQVSLITFFLTQITFVGTFKTALKKKVLSNVLETTKLREMLSIPIQVSYLCFQLSLNQIKM